MTRRILIGVTIDDSLQFHTGLPELLVQAGWEVHVVSGSGRRIEALRNIEGITAHVIEMAREPSPRRDLLALRQWFRVVRAVRPHVTFIGTPKAALLGNLAARVLRVKKRIYVLHGLRLETVKGPRRTILRAMEKLTVKTAHQVIAVSESLKSLAISEGIAPEAKVVVLGAGSCNGVDISGHERTLSSQEHSAFAASLGVDPSLPVVGFVGRLTRDKGLPELAEALSILNDRGCFVQLLIVGGVDDNSGKLALGALARTGQVVIPVGYREDPVPFYSLMDVLCLPSLREGLPGVILEAMASGVVVAATEATGIVDLVLPGHTGYLAARGSGASLAESLEAALSDGATTESFILNARELIAEKYDRSNVQEKLIDFIAAEL